MPGPDRHSESLERLLTRCAERVRQIGSRHRLDPAAVDEVFQEVRIRVWKAFRNDPEKIAALPASYVYRTASAAAIDLIRRARVRRANVTVPLDDPDVTSVPGSADAEPSAMGVQEEIHKALGELGPSRRPVVRMYLEGYERDEIGPMLGWTDAKVRNLLYRGLADLRSALERRGVGPPRGER